MPKLALFGGTPIREKPFYSSVVIDESEWSMVKQVLESKEMSRFMGSPSEDIERLLIMPSVQAEELDGQYFNFLGGQMVRRFESDFASHFGVDYAISVNSATSGIATALGAAGLGPGDEVITTCMSFNATALSILLFNSIPVFVDVSVDNFCLDPEEIRRAVTPHTKAILVVHLLGFPADMDEIMEVAHEHKLVVIEDCAQAPGTKFKGRYVGTIGDLGVFSFQETKNIMTGEGGMIITNNPLFAKKCRLIRNHGESVPDESWNEEDLVNIAGMNFRMTEITAALGIAQLQKLEENNHVRKTNADYLIENLDGLRGLKVMRFADEEFPHILPFVYDEEETGVAREIILHALRAEGIPVGSGYTRLMPENPIFQKKIAYGRHNCPWSCHLYEDTVSYSAKNYSVASGLLYKKFIWFYHIHSPNTVDEMKSVVQAFRKVFSNLKALRTYHPGDIQLSYKW